MRRRGARSRSPRRLRARRSAASTRAEERGMTTRRRKCGGRARRRLGTPSAAGSGCSPRSHKPSWAAGSTPSRAVPQPPGAPPDLGASGRRGPRTGPAPPARPLRTLSQSLSVDPLSSLFVCLSSKGAPARCKVLSRPGERHPRDGEEKPKSALRRSASLPGRQTPRASPE